LTKPNKKYVNMLEIWGTEPDLYHLTHLPVVL
jgi:uncharacterized protein YfbU (UPF0304 family)